jgi:hypothetical protein
LSKIDFKTSLIQATTIKDIFSRITTALKGFLNTKITTSVEKPTSYHEIFMAIKTLKDHKIKSSSEISCKDTVTLMKAVQIFVNHNIQNLDKIDHANFVIGASALQNGYIVKHNSKGALTITKPDNLTAHERTTC